MLTMMAGLVLRFNSRLKQVKSEIKNVPAKARFFMREFKQAPGFH